MGFIKMPYKPLKDDNFEDFFGRFEFINNEDIMDDFTNK